jgi:micrococcal nuclease
MVIGLASLLAACDAEDSPPSNSPGQGTSTAAPTATDFPPGLIRAEVTRVIDGDTIEVDIDGQEFDVRYIGIDTPESVDPRRPVECFGEEAAEYNRDLVDGKIVGLEKDVSETDDFGRLLRYVWLDGFLVNARLVTDGHALAVTYPPDVRYAELFAQLQAEAREAGRGLWGTVCEEPSPSPAGAAPGEASGSCDYSGSSDAMVKGNISYRTGERIYHVPGGEFYEKTVIDEAAGERWFCTESDAIAAGWRRSLH